MDLCRELGKTQKELLNPETGLDREDLEEWLAYQTIKPFGYDEERRRFGMVCAATYTAAGKSFKEEVEWTDFFRPSWEEPKKKQVVKTSKHSVDSLIAIFKVVGVPAKNVKKEKDGS